MSNAAQVLWTMRPELHRVLRGRWAGPIILPDAPQGPWWHGPGELLVCVGPWDPVSSMPYSLVYPPVWLHLSVSMPHRCPTYDEMTEVRDRFFRSTDTVIHVWPPAEEHYSHHPYCLHLWARTDGRREIPDLRGAGGRVGGCDTHEHFTRRPSKGEE